MKTPVDWEGLFEDYEAYRTTPQPAKPFEMPGAALHAISFPTPEDVRSITAALSDDKRKWLVAEVAASSKGKLAQIFLKPMLDAAIDEVNPSYNRSFIEPCLQSVGFRPVNDYLLEVLQTGTAFRKAGAANALYWAQMGLSFPPGTTVFTVEHATPESQAEYAALAAIWDRKKLLLLETFVSNPSADVRRSIIPKLDLDARSYPESHRQMVAQAIEQARSSDDDYIRHRIEVQLGNVNVFAPLPHREKQKSG